MHNIIVKDTNKPTFILLYYQQGIHVANITFKKDAYSDIQNLLASHDLYQIMTFFDSVTITLRFC